MTVHYGGNSFGGPPDFMLGVLAKFGCPFGRPGDRLYVRETWCCARIGGYDGREDGGSIWYRATDEGQLCHETKWHPSIHMPKRVARIWLEVTGVRVERLQDISREDAMAEGATSKPNSSGWDNKHDGWRMEWPDEEPAEGWSFISLGSPQDAFGNYINELHGGKNWNLKGSNIWHENPFMWVVEFRRVEHNGMPEVRA
jgi:hypothetical protein